MAQMIREGNGLPTLRCGIGLEGRAPVMVTQPFLGAEPLGEALPTRISIFSYRSKDLAVTGLPYIRHVEQQIDMLDDVTPYGHPIWLQIEQDSMAAAVFRWEGIFKFHTQRLTLRIPNFLRNPVVPRAEVRMAICAPDIGDDTAANIAALLRTLKQALEGSETTLSVKIFTDPETRSILKLTPRPGDRIMVDTAPLYDAGDREDFDDEVRNPWLRWIADTCRGERIDAVHFICPGQLSSESGALSLPATPMSVEGVSRSVDAQELTAFYDRLGCTTMGFTPLGNQSRHDGIRALAYELGWSRPGPILVDEISAELGMVYRAIFTGNGLPLDRDWMPLYCSLHPDLVGLGEEDVIASVAESHDMKDVARDFAVDVSRGQEMGTRGGWSGLPGEPPTPRPEPTLAETIIANERARISTVMPRTDIQKAQDVGAARALDFLQGVLER